MYSRLLHIYGPLSIQSYGFMIALGILVFLYFTYRHPVRKKLIPGNVYLNTVFGSIIAGVVGGRLLYVLTEWHEFQDRWIDVLFPWTGGGVVLGSIIGVILFVVWYLRRNNIVIIPVLDLAALYAPLLQSISRLGCLLAGCCYGALAPDGLWCALVFTDPLGAAPLHVALHPTQLYMSIASLGIFFLLQGLVRLINIKQGQLFFGYFALESFARFYVDFWRGDRGDLYSFSYGFGSVDVSVMQVLSFTSMFVCIIIFAVISCNFHKQDRYFRNHGSI